MIVDLLVSQPVSNSRWPFLPTASDVPPTAVIHGSEAEKSGDGVPRRATSSPLSPEEK